MKSTHDEIALQGIEFWSNVCDEEYELQLLQQEVTIGRIPGRKFRLIFRLKNRIGNRNEPAVTTHVAHCLI